MRIDALGCFWADIPRCWELTMLVLQQGPPLVAYAKPVRVAFGGLAHVASAASCGAPL